MITRQDALMRAQNQEDKQFIAHMYDLATVCDKSAKPRFTGFCDPRLIELTKPMLTQAQTFDVCAFGGYIDAERKMIGIFPKGKTCRDFPILFIKVTTKNPGKLSHRDYMGAVLSLGITRAQIGDIVCTDTGAVIICTDTMADFICDNLDFVKKEKVTCVCEDIDKDTLTKRTVNIEGTVASTRADAIISLFCNTSRTKVAELFVKGMVTVNYQPFYDGSKKLSQGDIISVKGFGKGYISSFGNLSKKGRLFITLSKYV